MLPTEHARFCEIVSNSLRGYGKRPTETDLEDWWLKCRSMTMDALEAGLKGHEDDPDRGDRIPRPVDITRRMKAGDKDAARCAATDATGQCQYPGIFSDGTAGEGPWFCPWHRQDRSGPEASRWIEVSREVPYEQARAKRIERMADEGKRSASTVATAHAIALRHGGKDWQGIGAYLPAHLQRDQEDAA